GATGVHGQLTGRRVRPLLVRPTPAVPDLHLRARLGGLAGDIQALVRGHRAQLTGLATVTLPTWSEVDRVGVGAGLDVDRHGDRAAGCAHVLFEDDLRRAEGGLLRHPLHGDVDVAVLDQPRHGPQPLERDGRWSGVTVDVAEDGNGPPVSAVLSRGDRGAADLAGGRDQGAGHVRVGAHRPPETGRLPA